MATDNFFVVPPSTSRLLRLGQLSAQYPEMRKVEIKKHQKKKKLSKKSSKKSSKRLPKKVNTFPINKAFNKVKKI